MSADMDSDALVMNQQLYHMKHMKTLGYCLAVSIVVPQVLAWTFLRHNGITTPWALVS